MLASGIEAFLPAVERLSKWKDRNKLVRFPLFSGYLFVNIVPDHSVLLKVLKTKGVVRILGTVPGEPEPVPDNQIFALKKVIENGASLDPYPYLTAGQLVRIKRGVLQGVEGIIVEKAGQHKLVISVDILRQSTSLTIDTSDIEKV